MRDTGPFIALAVWGVLFIAARLLLNDPGLAVEVRAAAVAAPAAVFAVFLWLALRAHRRSDEMERRITGEALATAFGFTLLAVTTLALAQRAGFAGPEDWSYGHFTPMMIVFYLMGLIMARRRYACAPE